MGDLIRIFRERFEGREDMSVHARKKRREALACITANWPALGQTAPGKITIHDIADFTSRLRTAAKVKMPKGTKTKRIGYAPATTKRILEVLKQVFGVGIESGCIAINPFAMQGKLGAPLQRKVESKKPELPPVAKMAALFECIGKPPAAAALDPRFGPGLRSASLDCAELIRGLAFSGMRLGEASAFVWEDIGSDTITVRGTKSETSRNRVVPIVSPMRELIAEMKARRIARAWPITGKVFRVSECQKSINRACVEVGIKRLTHHDFRHYFATVCIESGVDIPTVSRWLGHSDGGALAMRTYGHLRQEHSIAQAAKVTFTTTTKEAGHV